MFKHSVGFGAVHENLYVTRNSDSIKPVFQRLTMTQKSLALVGPHNGIPALGNQEFTLRSSDWLKNILLVIGLY